MSPRRRNYHSGRITTDSAKETPSSSDISNDSPMTNSNRDKSKDQEQEDNQDLTADETSSIKSTEGVVRLRSSVWQYAKKISQNKARCDKCKKLIKTVNGGTTTLKKHLIEVHGLIFLPASSSSKRTNAKLISRERKIRLDNLANMAIFEDGRTFGDLRRNGIRKFLAEAIPGYTPPHRNQVQQSLKRLHSSHISRLLKTLKAIKSIALTADFWSDRRQNSYLCVTGHYVDDQFGSKSTLLHFQAYHERHTAANISGEVYHCLHELGIEDKVTSVTCDGASNMTKAFDIFQNIDRIWCIAHRLHLTICNGFLLWKKYKKNDESNANSDDFNDMIDFKPSLDDIDPEETNDDLDEEDSIMKDSDEDDDDDDDDDDDENNDMITDSWGKDVMVGDGGNGGVGNVLDDDDNDDDAITKEKLAETIQKGRSLLKTIRQSQILTSFVNDDRKNYDNIKRRLVIDCITRWNSTYLSLKSLVDHKPVLLNLFENKGKLPITKKQKDKLFGLELSRDDWHLLTFLLEMFEAFYEATCQLSGSKYPTIGLALFMIRSLKEFFEKEDDEDHAIVVTLKKFISRSLNHYFDETDKQFELLMLYGYFDPVGYSALTNKERSIVERKLKQKHKDLVRSQSFNTTTTTSSTTDNINQFSNIESRTNSIDKNDHQLRFASFFKSIKKNVVDNKWLPKTISEEISLYSSLCLKNLGSDALIFWKNFGNQMPILKAMAQQYLGTPATSVPSESAFSRSAYIGRKERARLSPENLSYTMFVQDKLRSSST